MGCQGTKEAVAPMQMRVGEMIEVIERQQADLYGMTSEIKARLSDSPELQDNESKPKPTGYLNRLDAITDCNMKVLTILEKIMEVL